MVLPPNPEKSFSPKAAKSFQAMKYENSKKSAQKPEKFSASRKKSSSKSRGGAPLSVPSLPAELQQVNMNAAGIDVGATQHFVCVPEGRDPQPVRSFGAFTADLEAIADWLLECRVTTVAMEATGVYWIPLFELLERRGLEVKLVEPSRLKHVPGRKATCWTVSGSSNCIPSGCSPDRSVRRTRSACCGATYGSDRRWFVRRRDACSTCKRR